MSIRETQRRAWREAVARAAETLRDARRDYCATSRWTRSADRVLVASLRLRAALAAGKDWARPRAGADLGKWGAYLPRSMRDDPAMPWVASWCDGYERWVRRKGGPLSRKRRAAQRRGR